MAGIFIFGQSDFHLQTIVPGRHWSGNICPIWLKGIIDVLRCYSINHLFKFYGRLSCYCQLQFSPFLFLWSYYLSLSLLMLSYRDFIIQIQTLPVIFKLKEVILLGVWMSSLATLALWLYIYHVVSLECIIALSFCSSFSVFYHSIRKCHKRHLSCAWIRNVVHIDLFSFSKINLIVITMCGMENFSEAIFLC